MLIKSAITSPLTESAHIMVLQLESLDSACSIGLLVHIKRVYTSLLAVSAPTSAHHAINQNDRF